MIKKSILYSLFLTAIISFSSCRHGEKFEIINGVKSHYFVRNKNAQTLKVGDIMVMSLKITTMNDSVIFDSKTIPDFKMRLHYSNANIPTIDDALAGMHVNDSALFLINAESYYVITKRGTLPKAFKQNDMLKFYVKIKKILSLNDYQKQLESKNHFSAKIEESLLKRYLLHGNIKVKPTIDGLYFIEKQKGSGDKPQIGDIVTIHYTGTFIDGKPFDSSLERHKPLSFTFGKNQIIPGLEEGIAKMRKGGKAQLIIPSNLAYGSKGQGIIPPYSTLIFDVELLDIQK